MWQKVGCVRIVCSPLNSTMCICCYTLENSAKSYVFFMRFWMRALYSSNLAPFMRTYSIACGFTKYTQQISLHCHFYICVCVFFSKIFCWREPLNIHIAWNVDNISKQQQQQQHRLNNHQRHRQRQQNTLTHWQRIEIRAKYVSFSKNSDTRWVVFCPNILYRNT